ncbi:Uncharacterized protein dnm_080300 [Desulfonema magnum]|uniref:Uncharacterized protein n=1 Tax=Desulfonema magnum TaxID=45655 RepID=A0A975BV74_9BACT|nr:Uncharacterized protein dnm_080300 [Desulfonema magnum]
MLKKTVWRDCCLILTRMISEIFRNAGTTEKRTDQSGDEMRKNAL